MVSASRLVTSYNCQDANVNCTFTTARGLNCLVLGGVSKQSFPQYWLFERPCLLWSGLLSVRRSPTWSSCENKYVDSYRLPLPQAPCYCTLIRNLQGCSTKVAVFQFIFFTFFLSGLYLFTVFQISAVMREIDMHFFSHSHYTRPYEQCKTVFFPPLGFTFS